MYMLPSPKRAAVKVLLRTVFANGKMPRRFCSVSEPQKGFDRYIMSFSTDGCRLERNWEGVTRVLSMSFLMARAKTAGRFSRYHNFHFF